MEGMCIPNIDLRVPDGVRCAGAADVGVADTGVPCTEYRGVLGSCASLARETEDADDRRKKGMLEGVRRLDPDLGSGGARLDDGAIGVTL